MPPGLTCTPTAGGFYNKTKVSEENLQVDYYLLLQYRSRQCALCSPTWSKSLSKSHPKM